MKISPARRLAFDVLRRVANEGAYASELLYTRLGTDNTLGSSGRSAKAQADAALSTELTLGVLRWQRLLDFLLQRHLDRPIETLDIEVLLALRLGLYQLRFLNRVPAHAAVSESVELAKQARKRSAAALVNAVLRHAVSSASVSGEELERLLPPDASTPERAAILHSHPTWMAERWFTAFGPKRALALMAANNRAPLLSCTVLEPERIDEIAQSLAETFRVSNGGAAETEAPSKIAATAAGAATRSPRKTSFHLKPGVWLRSALSFAGGNPAEIEVFRAGLISFQDEASQMIAHLADAQPGQRVLDVCAAPGGKMLLLARAVTGGGAVIASDFHVHRLRSIRDQLSRTRTHNVSLLALDAAEPLPFRERFDRILVDTPCSGTGTLARNPEIRWRLATADLGAAQQRQAMMLRRALPLLAPGGRLVYATCSLEPEENEQVVDDVLRSDRAGGFRVVSGKEALARHLRPGVAAASLFDRQGFFRTFPPETQTDGFFAAVIEHVS